MTGHIKFEKKSVSKQCGDYGPRQRLQEQIDQRDAMSRRGLWEMLLFLLVSVCVYYFRDFNLFAEASEPVRQVLGCPPPAYMVSIALAVYGFSAMTLALTAMANDARPLQRWNHFGYRCSFFLFYSFSGTIAAHFLPVVLVGLALYALDQCHIWMFNAKFIHQQKELFEKF